MQGNVRGGMSGRGLRIPSRNGIREMWSPYPYMHSITYTFHTETYTYNIPMHIYNIYNIYMYVYI